MTVRCLRPAGHSKLLFQPYQAWCWSSHGCNLSQAVTTSDTCLCQVLKWSAAPRPCWGRLLQGQQHCKPVSEHHDGLENTFSKDRNSFRAWPRHIARTPSPRRGRRALAAPTPRRRLGRLAVESIKHNFELKLHSESLKEHDFLTNLFRGRHKGRKKSI